MAGGQERILRGRIRTVQATKKITRAMELIAASGKKPEDLVLGRKGFKRNGLARRRIAAQGIEFVQELRHRALRGDTRSMTSLLPHQEGCINPVGEPTGRLNSVHEPRPEIFRIFSDHLFPKSLFVLVPRFDGG